MQCLVIAANGFEETELVATVDVLRRAGIDVTVAGLNTTLVEGARKLRIVADARLDEIDCKNYDALILPGGNPGYKNLANSSRVMRIIKQFNRERRIIAAICASPYVLAKAGILEDRIATVYPGFEKLIPKPRDARVIVCGNVITARGPGDVFLFALKLVEILAGKKKASEIAERMLIKI